MAASVGPAAVVASPRAAPTRRNLLSPRFYLLVALAAAGVIVAGVVRTALTGDAADGVGFVTGLIVGMLVPLTVLGALAAWRNRSR